MIFFADSWLPVLKNINIMDQNAARTDFKKNPLKQDTEETRGTTEYGQVVTGGGNMKNRNSNDLATGESRQDNR